MADGGSVAVVTLRVLWVIKGLGPGGAERLLVDHAATSGGSVAYECAFVLSWKQHLRADLEANGVPCTPMSRWRRDVLWPVRLMRAVRNSDADVIHVHSPLPGCFVRLANRGRRPIVSTQHNSWGTFRRLTRRLAGWRLAQDAAIICVSDEVRASLPCRSDAVRVLRHGIDIDSAAALVSDRQATRDELGVGDGVVLVTVANFRAQKDYPTLFASVAASFAAGAAFHLLVIGQGPLRNEVARLHADHGFGDRVRLLGFRADARRIVAACDGMVLASRWEGQPVAIMEALAAGLPVVATDVGGVGEMLRDVASLVPPGDSAALSEALCELVERHPTVPVVESQRAAAAFDARRSTEAIEAIYAAAVDRHRSRS